MYLGNKKIYCIFKTCCIMSLIFQKCYFFHTYIFFYLNNTGSFLSPPGISDLWGTVTRMITPKESMSTEGEKLHVSVVLYRCLIYPPLVTYQAPDECFLRMFDSRWPQPVHSFCSVQAATTVISCTTHKLFCSWVVLCGTWSKTSIALSQLTQF
jgi:hypothetical protein